MHSVWERHSGGVWEMTAAPLVDRFDQQLHVAFRRRSDKKLQAIFVHGGLCAKSLAFEIVLERLVRGMPAIKRFTRTVDNWRMRVIRRRSMA